MHEKKTAPRAPRPSHLVRRVLHRCLCARRHCPALAGHKLREVRARPQAPAKRLELLQCALSEIQHS